MATQNVMTKTTIKAGEDLSDRQYHAIALDDGEIADNSHEAGGILINKPKENEFLTLGIDGEIKYRAGAAVAIGNRLRVTTSGYFVKADSGYYTIGRAKSAITSGSIGTGLFDFRAPFYQSVDSL